jgi:hypothetical protein
MAGKQGPAGAGEKLPRCQVNFYLGIEQERETQADAS